MERGAPVEPEDEELVALARKGDASAFGELVERHKRKAYRIAFDFTDSMDTRRSIPGSIEFLSTSASITVGANGARRRNRTKKKLLAVWN